MKAAKPLVAYASFWSWERGFLPRRWEVNGPDVMRILPVAVDYRSWVDVHRFLRAHGEMFNE